MSSVLPCRNGLRSCSSAGLPRSHQFFARELEFILSPNDWTQLTATFFPMRQGSEGGRIYNESIVRQLFLRFDCIDQKPADLGPVAAIQRSVLDCLGNMFGLNLGCSVQISDRAGHLQDAVVSPCTESLLLHGALQQPFAVAGEFAVSTNLAGTHLRIRVDALASGGKPVQLHLAGLQYALANCR